MTRQRARVRACVQRYAAVREDLRDLHGGGGEEVRRAKPNGRKRFFFSGRRPRYAVRLYDFTRRRRRRRRERARSDRFRKL